MLKIRLKPSKEYFSHDRLVNCFSIKTIKSLHKLEKKYEKILYLVDDVSRDIKLDDKISDKIQDLYLTIVYVFENNSILNANTNNYEIYWKEGCQYCEEKKALEWGHIVQSAFFRNRPKKSKYLKRFEKHIINMFRLCPTHHTYLDLGHFSKKELNKLINFKRREIKRIDTTMGKELKLLEKTRKLFKKPIRINKIKELDKKWGNYYAEF